MLQCRLENFLLIRAKVSCFIDVLILERLAETSSTNNFNFLKRFSFLFTKTQKPDIYEKNSISIVG
jgi:hypothetical protein